MAPLAIRGSISAGMNFAIVLGQLIGYGVMRQASLYGDARSYRVLFATQWGFAAVGLAILPFFPESPYFLVAHNQPDKARKNLEKLHKADYDFDGHMAEIQESLSKINSEDASQGGLLECFGKDAWRRTLVATSMFFIQNACGSVWVIGYMSCKSFVFKCRDMEAN
jgi:MFS family permease